MGINKDFAAKPSLSMSPLAKAFLIGAFIGAAFGTFYSVFELLGEDIGEVSS